jgi:hypothetical protein
LGNNKRECEDLCKINGPSPAAPAPKTTEKRRKRSIQSRFFPTLPNFFSRILSFFASNHYLYGGFNYNSNDTIMKKTLFLILFAAFTIGGMSAQNVDMKRTVLFTLGPNEEICLNEYFASQYIHQKRFVCIVENKQAKTRTLVVNGKRVQTVKGTYEVDYSEDYGWNVDLSGGTLDVFYFDPTKEDGYGYVYELAGRAFINVGGKILSDVSGYPYDFRMTESGKFAFKYGDNSSRYLYVDGKTFGPYHYISDFAIAESGKFAFAYQIQSNGNYYVCADGQTSGPYGGFLPFSISENGNYAYIGTKYVNPTEVYLYGKEAEPARLIVNGTEKTFGTYRHLKVSIADDGSYAVVSRDGRSDDYVTVGEKTYGPYSYVEDIKINGKESFGFRYSEKDSYGNRLYHVNGNDDASKKDFENIPSDKIPRYNYLWKFSHAFANYFDDTIEVVSPDTQRLFFSNFAYAYVVIDGKELGHSPALNAWYNEDNHSFGWSSIEGKDLVVYEHKL